jgi:hypothetical protein
VRSRRHEAATLLYAFDARFNLWCSSTGETPRRKNRFCAAVWPAINSICDFFSPSPRASNSTIALLALPFSGAWVMETRSIPSCPTAAHHKHSSHSEIDGARK